jgi:hypothetical protein
MSSIHKVATVQSEPTMFEKEHNIAWLLELCEAAVAAGAQLVVTPIPRALRLATIRLHGRRSQP